MMLGSLMAKKTKNLVQISDRNIGKFQKGSSVATIYIGNLRYDIAEKQLKKMFRKYGEVSFIKLMLDTKTQKSKGFAFIQMPNKQDANKAVTSLNAREYNGRTLKVSFAKDSEQPREEFTPQVKEEPIKINPPKKRKRRIDFTTLFNS